jgi:uncharacterized protein YecT (DUF1311 family)
MKLVTWTAALVVALAFNTSIGASGQSQTEMNMEAGRKYEKTDAELNRIYQRIMHDYAGDKVFIQKMKIAQRAWIAFRDAHLDSISHDSEQSLGSATPMCQSMILEELTRDRIKSLREWVDGVDDGCAGSRKLK